MTKNYLQGKLTAGSNSGINIDSANNISVTPATTSAIGGVKVGTGLSVTADGTVSSPSNTKTITFSSISVSSTDWVADTTYTGYGYKAVITATGATSDTFAEVIFAPIEADSGNYAPVAETGTDTVTIYSKVNTAITIPTIMLTKVV